MSVVRLFQRWAALRRPATLAGLLLWSGLAAAADPAPVVAESKLGDALRKTLAAEPEQQVAVLVRLKDRADLRAAARIADWDQRGWAVYRALHDTAQRSQAGLLQRARSAERSGNVSAIKPLWIVNLVALSGNRSALLQLAELPEVAGIQPALKLEPPELVREPDSAPLAIEWGVSKIRAPEVWSTYATTGAGTVVANVDTGVQYNHPALVGQYRGNLGGGSFEHNYNWYDPTGASVVPTDGNSHGTHVMGTEVGTDGGSNQIGVAPGARWMAAFGCCPSNDALLEAQQFMLAPTRLDGSEPNPGLRPHVLNQSWGGPGGSEIFEEAIAALRASGVFPAFSAGNNGGAAADGCGRLGSPGDNPSAFNVGSTDSSDNISSSSSRGPNPVTGAIGPAVSAPGVSIRSSVPGNSYSNFSGTSMASPHVAGAVALLISVEPALAGQVEQLEELLRKTAAARTTTQVCGGVAGSAVPNNTYGWGRIDVKAAADMVWQAGWIEGLVTVGGQPRPNAVVSFSLLGKTLTTRTDAQGRYRVVAGAGSWAMSASFEGQSLNAATVAVSQDQTSVQNFALPAAATYVVSGTVRQSGAATPVPAMIVVRNSDTIAPVWADAAGAYQLTLPNGSWELQIVHPGYQPLLQTVAATQVLDPQLVPRANYLCLDNTQAGGPSYAWTDISSSGTALNLDDDASSSAITLPGTFTYFGNNNTTVRINSNGFLFFGTTNFTTANMYLPFEGRPNNDVMALGEDLNPALGAQGTIYWRVTGAVLTVQYQQVQHWASGFPETFQIQLDTDADTITYLYNTLSQPDFTSVGLEDSTGSAGQLYSFRNSANLVAGRAVQFTPATGTGVNWGCDHALTLTLSDSVDPAPLGAPLDYLLHWNVTGFGGAPQAQLRVELPANVSFVSASGGVQPVAGVLTWNLGNLRPNASGSASVRLIPNSGATAELGATFSDLSGETRSADQTTTLEADDSVFANGFE